MFQFQIIPLTKTKTHNGKRKFAMIRQTGPFCIRCHKWKEIEELTVDHKVPKYMGLPNEEYDIADNRQLICDTCHRIKFVLERAFKHKIKSRKSRYLLFINGFEYD